MYSKFTASNVSNCTHHHYLGLSLWLLSSLLMASQSKFALSQLLGCFDATIAERDMLPLQSLKEAAVANRHRLELELRNALAACDEALSQASGLSMKLRVSTNQVTELKDRLSELEEQHALHRKQWKANFERANKRFDALKAAVQSSPDKEKIMKRFRITSSEPVKADTSVTTCRKSANHCSLYIPKLYLCGFCLRR